VPGRQGAGDAWLQCSYWLMVGRDRACAQEAAGAGAAGGRTQCAGQVMADKVAMEVVHRGAWGDGRGEMGGNQGGKWGRVPVSV